MNQRGFSLVQTLLAAGMLGGVSLVLMQMGQNQSRIQRSAAESLEMNELQNRVQRVLLNSDACQNTLQGLTLASVGDKIPVSEIKNASGDVVLTVSDNATPSMKITEMGIERIGSEEVVLEMTLEKRGQNSIGARTVTKRFNLGASFGAGGVIDKCFSQLDNAVQSACTALGGHIVGAECVETRVECKTDLEFFKLRKLEGTATICGEEWEIKREKILKTNRSTTSYSLPSTYIEGSLIVHLLGAGGGGGCGCADGGEGGGRGAVEEISNTGFLKPGNSISYFLGKGGDGGKGNGCRFNNYTGKRGEESKVTLNGTSYLAAGGRFGSAKQGSNESGESVTFVGSTYGGGVYRSNSNGAPGGTGAGGAGGEKTAVNCRGGGKGGDGAIMFEYLILKQNS